MSKYLKLPDYNLVPNRIALAQLAIALSVSIILYFPFGLTAAYSAILAGLVSAISSWYSGRKIFNSRAKTAEQFVHNIYLAQFMKLFLVVALICVIFSTVKVDFIAFVVTYALTLTIYGFAFVTSKFGLKVS